MITGTLKSKIDKLWLEFWASGITSPLTVIEQISFLCCCMLGMREIAAEKTCPAPRQQGMGVHFP